MININLITGNTGSGKTFHARKQIISELNSTPYVCIVGKSISFLEESAQYFQSNGIKVIELHSGATSSCRLELIKLFNPLQKSDYYTTEPHVLLITTTMYRSFSAINQLAKRYKIYHDEFEAKITGEVDFGPLFTLEEHIMIDHQNKITLTPECKAKLRMGDLKEMKDEHVELLMPLFLNNYSIFMTDKYNRRDNKIKTDTITMSYIGFINENYYNEQDTIITQNGEYVKTILNTSNITETKISGATMNKTINIINIQKERLSKYKMDRNLPTYSNALRDIQNSIKGKYLLSVNNSLKKELENCNLIDDNTVLLNANCEGMNEYRNINNIVFLYTCNPKPQEFKIYKQQFNLDPDQIFQMETLEKAKQHIARSSLRDPNNESVINIWVAGDMLAEALVEYYEGLGCTVNYKTDYLLTITRKYNNPYDRAMTAAEKQKLYRLRKKMTKLAEAAK